MRAVFLSVAVAATVAAAGARDAAACSCGAEALAHPADGAAAVPTTTIVLWSAIGSEPPVLRPAGGAPVELALEDHRYDNYYGPVWLGRPAAPLEPGTGYELCALVGGDERCARFTTGDARDDLAPALAAPTALYAQRLRNLDGGCDALCWGSPSDGLVIDHEPASEAGYAVIEVRRQAYEDLSWSFLRPIDPASRRTAVFNTYCGPSVISLEEGVVYCSRMRELDGSGNQSPTTAEMCGAATTCEITGCQPPPDGTCPALEPPDAGPAAVDEEEGETGSGCAVGATGSRNPAWLMLGLELAISLATRRRRTAHGPPPADPPVS